VVSVGFDQRDELIAGDPRIDYLTSHLIPENGTDPGACAFLFRHGPAPCRMPFNNLSSVFLHPFMNPRYRYSREGDSP
jgi:hypothetical protein